MGKTKRNSNKRKEEGADRELEIGVIWKTVAWVKGHEGPAGMETNTR